MENFIKELDLVITFWHFCGLRFLGTSLCCVEEILFLVLKSFELGLKYVCCRERGGRVGRKERETETETERQRDRETEKGRMREGWTPVRKNI